MADSTATKVRWRSPGAAKGRQVITINTTLSDLISFAYEVHARQPP